MFIITPDTLTKLLQNAEISGQDRGSEEDEPNRDDLPSYIIPDYTAHGSRGCLAMMISSEEFVRFLIQVGIEIGDDNGDLFTNSEGEDLRGALEDFNYEGGAWERTYFFPDVIIEQA